MIYSNTLSIYLIQNFQNDIFDQNLRPIQDAMRSDDPSGSKFKHICTDFTNLEVLTRSAIPGYAQVTYAHTSIENNPLGKTITTLALEVSLEAPTMVSIDTKRAFAGYGKKIYLPTTEVLLCATSSDLQKPKKLRD